MNTPMANCLGTGRAWRVGGPGPQCPFCRRGPKSLGLARSPRRIGQAYAGRVPPHQDLRVEPLAELRPVGSNLALGVTASGAIMVITTEGMPKVEVDPAELAEALEKVTAKRRAIRYPSKETAR